MDGATEPKLPHRKRGGRIHGEKSKSRPDRRARQRDDGGAITQGLPTAGMIPNVNQRIVPEAQAAVSGSSLPHPQAQPVQDSGMKPSEVISALKGIKDLKNDSKNGGGNRDPSAEPSRRGGRVTMRARPGPARSWGDAK
jgi:hypothetical protein